MRISPETKKRLPALIPAALLVLGILIYFQWNKGTLEVHSPGAFSMTVESKSEISENGVAKMRLNPDNYQVLLTQERSLPIVQLVTIARGQTTRLDPVFERIPILNRLEIFPDVSLTPDSPSVMSNSNFSHALLYQPDLATKELVGLPENILAVQFFHSSPFALISAYGSSEDLNVSQWWYDLRTDTLTATPFVFDNVSWNVAGNRVAFFTYNLETEEGSLTIQDTQKILEGPGTEITRFQLHPGLTLEWSPDNASFIAIPQRSDLSADVYEVDLATGEKTKLLDEGFFTHASWSPDGTKVALERVTDLAPLEPEIWIYDFETHAGTKVLDKVYLRRSVWSPDSRSLTYVTRGSSAAYSTPAPPKNEEETETDLTDLFSSPATLLNVPEETDTFSRYSLDSGVTIELYQTNAVDRIDVQELHFMDPMTIRFYSFRIEDTPAPEHVDWYELEL